MQDCADKIAISESDMCSIDAIDDVWQDIIDEVLPEIVTQLGYMQVLRERLRLEKFGK